MRLEDDIEETATRVCDAMAGAIELYANVSGVADDFPEHFIAAHVLTNLGSVLTMTMETNSTKLWQRNREIRQRWADPSLEQLPSAIPSEYISQVGGRRADLVLLRGDHTKKKETEFLCLVEFKTWNDTQEDVRKIRQWFPFVDTCPWGMTCGLTTHDHWPDIVRKRTESEGDKFVKGRIARPLSEPKNIHTFASVLANPNYKGPGA